MKNMRYEVYDYNDEIIDSVEDVYEALGCAEVMEAKFILDTEKNEVIWGSTNER